MIVVPVRQCADVHDDSAAEASHRGACDCTEAVWVDVLTFLHNLCAPARLGVHPFPPACGGLVVARLGEGAVGEDCELADLHLLQRAMGAAFVRYLTHLPPRTHLIDLRLGRSLSVNGLLWTPHLATPCSPRDT